MCFDYTGLTKQKFNSKTYNKNCIIIYKNSKHLTKQIRLIILAVVEHHRRNTQSIKYKNRKHIYRVQEIINSSVEYK